MNRGRSQVIELRLNRAEEMFVLAQTDLFSEYRNLLTGVEYCISLLRSRPAVPLRLRLSVPPAEFREDLNDYLGVALRRYCDQRIRHNEHERRAVRLDGLASSEASPPPGTPVPMITTSTNMTMYSDSLMTRHPSPVAGPFIGSFVGWEAGQAATGRRGWRPPRAACARGPGEKFFLAMSDR